MTSTLIGLSGYARTGKDTAAEFLVERGVTRASFADVLREFAYQVNPVVLGHLPGGKGRLRYLVDTIGWEASKEYAEVRELLQRIGTDAGRNVLGNDVWVNAAFARIVPGTPVVFADVRFVNEAVAIRRRGGVVLRVERMGYGPVNDHPSETALDNFPFDAYVRNTAGLDYLAASLFGALGDLGVEV